MAVLTIIDVCSIQKFIFSSNRLQDIVAASQTVEWAVSKENDVLRKHSSKIIRAAGGSALLEFSNENEAKKFAAEYSRMIFDLNPNMEIAISHLNFEKGNLAKAIKQIYQKLEKNKAVRTAQTALPGLGVTVSCVHSGMPANKFDKDKRPICNAYGKNMVIADSSLNLNEKIADNCFVFSQDFDKLGRTKNDTSYLGVVHIDGNGIGKKLEKWLNSQQNCQDDEKIKQDYQKISSQLYEVFQDAFQQICIIAKQQINPGEKDPEMKGNHDLLNFEVYRENGKVVLPIRPVIIGGDDMTFVCDGRIALFMSQKILEKIEQAIIPVIGKIGACAGVAFIKVHSPFIRGYELAEDLCSNAKRQLYDTPDIDKTTDCLIDWHIGNIRPGQSIEDIREVKYKGTSNKTKLTSKPYRLDFKNRTEPGNWFWFSETVLGKTSELNSFRSSEWLERRNKMKSMVSVLKNEDQNDFKNFMDQVRITGSETNLPSGIVDSGITQNSGNTAIVDAIEVLDIHQTFGEQGVKQ